MLDNKTILLTGGTGSFGRKFVEMVLRDYNPERLIIYSRDELKQHDMQMQFPDPRLRFFLGDVRDRDRLYRALRAGVDVIVHAAALKQVPACEYNPFEAVKTNILGGQNIIDAAIDCGVKRVIALSTDKAVAPVNLYGATKLCAEKLFVHGNAYNGGGITHFSCVRYGNVMGSRGSVIPVLRAQRDSGVVTVTDQRMTRFWLTLDEAVNFVLNSLREMQGGEVFVPRIPSMGIMDLVEAVAPGCEIRFTGIRPGEKLHETLVSLDEARHTVDTGRMFAILPEVTKAKTDRWPDAKPLPEGFAFSSDRNDRWLTVDDLRSILGEQHAVAAVRAAA